MTRSTRKSLLATVALTLTGGCATVPAVLAPTDREACAVNRGVDFRFVICAERGRPHTLGDDRVSPNLFVRLDSLDTAKGDLRDWHLTVCRDGKVIRRGPLPSTPADGFVRRTRADTFVRLPGARWAPGRYHVKLLWTLESNTHVAAEFLVLPIRPGPRAPPARR